MTDIDASPKVQRINVSRFSEAGVQVLARTQKIVVNSDKSVAVVLAGPIGPSGANGSDANSSYTHHQTLPSPVWTVQHNLGYRPAGVDAFDVLGSQVGGLVTHVTDNVLLITFLSARVGKAYVS